MSEPKIPSASKQLQTFAAKRRALERLLLLARSMSKLSGSLENLTSLKVSSDQLSLPAQEFYDRLSQRLNSKSPEEVVQQMTDLDNMLRADMEHIVSLSSADESSIDQRIRALNPAFQASTAELLDDYLADFERRAKLAIALRLFLSKRKIPTPGIEFSFSEDQLERELVKVKERESKARETVRIRVVDLIDDTENILNNSSYPESVRDEILGVRKELLDCLSHIDSGKDIISLPLIVEEVVINDTPAEQRKPRPPEPPPDEAQEGETDTEDSDEKTSTAKSDEQRPSSALDLPDVRHPSFVRILWVWLKTPNTVDWAQAKKIAHWELNKKSGRG